MEIQRALEIIHSLAEGKDPYHGEELPKTSPYQQGDTVRALNLAMEGLRTLEHKTKRLHNLPKNSGNPWGIEEDRELVKAFKCGHTVPELAKKHHRTEGAITSRLFKLGVIKISSIKGNEKPQMDNDYNIMPDDPLRMIGHYVVLGFPPLSFLLPSLNGLSHLSD